MDGRWGVLKLVGGLENDESGGFVHSREEQDGEEESAARVIEVATGTSTTPVARRKCGLRWIITLTSFPGTPIPWEIRLNLFSTPPPLIPRTTSRTTTIPENHRKNTSQPHLLLSTSTIPPSAPFIAPFLAVLIMAVGLYRLSSGELLRAGQRGTSGSRQWMFIGDDQVMLQPPEDVEVYFSGFGRHGGGDDARWSQSSGERWEDFEPGEWDGGGMLWGE